MRSAALLAIWLLAGATLYSAEPVPMLQPDVQAEEEAEPLATPTPVAENGFEYRVQLSQLIVKNGAPLAYTPLELGWRFGQGWRFRTGLDLFYYEGKEIDPKLPQLGELDYSYEMFDWRTSFLYQWRRDSALRPVAGVSVDWVRGDRKRTVLGASRDDAWGFIGLGAALGLEYRLGPNWALSFTGRGAAGGGAAWLAATDLGILYLY